jgi:hypothetical protein
MNNPITVRIKSDIGITDEQKNELREKLVYVFIEQLRKSGMYKVTEGKNGNVWILRADLILPKKYEPEPVNGWISIEDRLPELFENVLTIDSEGKIFINWLEEITENKSYFAYGGGSVTHWQPLPEPPKGE